MDNAMDTVSNNVDDPQMKASASKTPLLHVTRPIFTQRSFDSRYDHHRQSISVLNYLENKCFNCVTSRKSWRSKLKGIFPFIDILSTYVPKRDLSCDLISGFTVGVMHMPQGMAYALLAGLKPVYGLYVSLFPAFLYFFFGTSRHISIGTFAVVCLMVGQVVDHADCPARISSDSNNSVDYYNLSTKLLSVSQDEDTCRLKVATAVTLVTGIIQFIMGGLHLGFVSMYLSDPLTRGFTTGAAFHVFTSQVKHILGLNVSSHSGSFRLIHTYIEVLKMITKSNHASIIISLICIAFLVFTKEFVNPKLTPIVRMPLPAELLVVITATAISHFAKLGNNFGIPVVGDISLGLPPPSLPNFGVIPAVIVPAISIAVVSFAVNLSMAKMFAKKHGYVVNANQELIAYGICNTVGSFLNCFVASASLSRSLVQEDVGGVTQVAGLISCTLICFAIYAVGSLFEDLPKATLAAIIVVALKGMFLQLKDIRNLWKVDFYDCCVWLVVFLATVILDVDVGLIIGLAFNLLTVIFRTQRPLTVILGRVPHTDIYQDIDVYEVAEEIPGIKIFRFEAALYYANQEHFIHKLFEKTVDPTHIKADKDKNTNEDDLLVKIHTIIIDCSMMAFMDSVGVDCLAGVIKEYAEIGVRVMIAGCKGRVRDMLDCSNFRSQINETESAHLWLANHDAVLAALQNDPVVLLEDSNIDIETLTETVIED